MTPGDNGAISLLGGEAELGKHGADDGRVDGGPVGLVVDVDEVDVAVGLCGYDGIGDDPRTTRLAAALGGDGHADFADAGE